MSALDETAGALADVARALVRAAADELVHEELQRLRDEHARVTELARTWLRTGLKTYPASDVTTEDKAARELLDALGEPES